MSEIVPNLPGAEPCREYRVVATSISYVAAGDVPAMGIAIKDTRVFAYGEHVGELLRIDHVGTFTTVDFLRSDRRGAPKHGYPVIPTAVADEHRDTHGEA